MAELLDESRTGRTPIEVGSRLGRVGALVEQEDFGEIVAEACPGLIVGAGDRPGRAGRDRRRLGELGNRRVLSIADHEVAASRVVFQRAPERVRQVRDMDRRPALPSGAEHDQVARVVLG